MRKLFPDDIPPAMLRNRIVRFARMAVHALSPDCQDMRPPDGCTINTQRGNQGGCMFGILEAGKVFAGFAVDFPRG